MSIFKLSNSLLEGERKPARLINNKAPLQGYITSEYLSVRKDKTLSETV